MGLDNVAVQWPRTGRFYDPVAPAEFVDFGGSPTLPRISGPAAALAEPIAKTGTVQATAYTELIDLLLGLEGVLYATDAAAEDEDPVIDPDGCAWIAGGLETFVAGHGPYGEAVTFETVSDGPAFAARRRPAGRAAAALAGEPARRAAGRERRSAAVELHLLRAGRAGRASTGAAPIAASPSTPTPDRRAVRGCLVGRPVGRGDHLGEHRVQVLQVLDGQPEPLHDRGRDQFGLASQGGAAGGQGDGEAALVGWGRAPGAGSRLPRAA